jgi:hypothetical protein
MAERKFLVNINLTNQQLLNASLQNLLGNPATAGKQPGWIYFDTGANTVYTWTGSVWLDLGATYTHPTFTAFTPTLTGANVLATFTTNTQGHVTALTTRILTPGDIGAATAAHTHTLSNITDVTASAAEVNAATDLVGLTTGMVYRATGATTAAWSQPFNDSINNSTSQGWSSSKIQTELNNITNIIAGGLVNKGGYNAATNVPDLDVNPAPLAIKNGWMYTVTADGLFFTEQVRAGDVLIANQDNPTTLAHWTRVEKNTDLATETSTGLVEIATQAEVNSGTLDQYYVVTPLKLVTYINTRLIQATETALGIAELATQTETNTGTDDLRIVTPLKLAGRTATETRTGIAEIATQAETDAGTDDLRFVTPLKLKTTLNTIGVGSFAQDIGDGAATAIAVTHNLNTLDVEIELYEKSTGETVEAQYVRTSVNIVTVSFNIAPTAAQYRVVIKK